jgi:hypothetical protein
VLQAKARQLDKDDMDERVGKVVDERVGSKRKREAQDEHVGPKPKAMPKAKREREAQEDEHVGPKPKQMPKRVREVGQSVRCVRFEFLV